MTLMEKISGLEQLSKEIATLDATLKGSSTAGIKPQPYRVIFGGDVIVNHLDKMHAALQEIPDKLAQKFDIKQVILDMIVCSGYKKHGIPSEAMLMASHYVATTCMRNLTVKSLDDVRIEPCGPEVIQGAVESFIHEDDPEFQAKRDKMLPKLAKACSIAYGWMNIIYKLAMVTTDGVKLKKTKSGIQPEAATFMCYLHMLAHNFATLTVDNIVKLFEGELETMLARKRLADAFGVIAPDNPEAFEQAKKNIKWDEAKITVSLVDDDGGDNDWVVPEIEVTK